jgi:diguanylate cyclase (GGDEF)-like protein
MFLRASISFRTAAFVVTVCAALLAIDGWNSWQSRADELRQMEVAAANLARAMAQQADDAIKKADTVLIGIVERVEHDGIGPLELTRLRRVLAAQVAELPQLDGLHIYDKDGNQIANSRPTPPENLNNADRAYFVFHRLYGTRGPHIGVPVKSRTSGKLVVTVSRRINHVDGSFAGVALAAIDVDFFLRFYDSLNIGKAGAVALVLEDGTMMMRRPYSPGVVGRDMRETGLFRAYTAQESVGTAYIQSAQDGVTRLNSFRRLDNYPLFVAAALSKDEILADWWRKTIWHSAGVALLTMIAGLIGWRLVRQFQLQGQTEAELRQARDALETLNKALSGLAMQDGLTGLGNRRQFDLALASEFSRAARSGRTLALIMMDVDCFKQYNDFYGHAAGDECLRAVGRAVAQVACQRAGDLAVRYGGDELAVLLPDTDLDGAVLLAQRIRSAVRALNIEHARTTEGFVTLSAGVEAFRPVGEDVEPTALIRAADKALYAAKAAGRNRVHPAERPVPA